MPSPSSPPFPSPTLFRSCTPATSGNIRTLTTFSMPRRLWRVLCRRHRLCLWAKRSEERVSRNAEPELPPLSLPDPLPILYAGNFGKYQNFDNILDAAKALASTLPEASFVFVGEEIGRAGQQECRARAPPPFPPRPSSDLVRRQLREISEL